MAGERSSVRTRRAVLGAAVGTVGVFAAEAIARPAAVRAGTDGDVRLGLSNNASTPTLIVVPEGDAFQAATGGEGNTALFGQAQHPSAGHGVYGGVFGTSSDAIGVWGNSIGGKESIGVKGTCTVGSGGSPAGVGVWGSGAVGVTGTGTEMGVQGVGNDGGTGLVGMSNSGAGIEASSNTGTAARFYTLSASATALRTEGKVVFADRSGRISVGVGRKSAYRTITGVTTASLVIATLASNRSGWYVRAAVASTGRVTVYLNKTVTTKAISVTFLVLN
jgi:hypothetical protein